MVGCGEEVDFDSRTLTVDAGCGDTEKALAHLIAHLDLGHHLQCTGQFTAAQEKDAEALAVMRLDRPGWFNMPPIDGDPSVRELA